MIFNYMCIIMIASVPVGKWMNTHWPVVTPELDHLSYYMYKICLHALHNMTSLYTM